MSKGSGSRDQDGKGPRGERGNSRSSRTSVPMTSERAKAIQSHADRTGTNQDWKARSSSAADRNETKED